MLVSVYCGLKDGGSSRSPIPEVLSGVEHSTEFSVPSRMANGSGTKFFVLGLPSMIRVVDRDCGNPHR